MSLNLGLEALEVSTETVTVSDLLAGELASLEAQQESERALYDAATMARNVYNYNEVIGSLEKHASQECMDFASELLGFKVGKKAEKAEVKPSVGKRVVDALQRWWKTFADFVATSAKWVADQVRTLIAKLNGTFIDDNPKVHFDENQLDAFESACTTGWLKDPKKAADAFNNYYSALKARKSETHTINLRRDGAVFLRKANSAQVALAKLMKQTATIDSKEKVEAVVAMQKVNPKVQRMILSDVALISKYLNRAEKADKAKYK